MHEITARPLKLFLIASFLCSFISVAVNAQQGPELFSYPELVQLYEQETPAVALQDELHLLLTTPFLSNAATARGVKPLLPRTPSSVVFSGSSSGTSSVALNLTRSAVPSQTLPGLPN